MPEIIDSNPVENLQEQNVMRFNSEEQKSQEQLIDDIIKERGNKAKDVNVRIGHLESLKKKLSEYESLRCQIIDGEGNLIENGPFASIFRKNPDMIFAVKDADSRELVALIDNQLEVLKRLKKRFERKTISIQIFGLAGNGKSKFIQTISGLDNNTVLTSEADHTTGATTYIQNASNFKAHIYGYTRKELLDIFNASLKYVLVKCGKPVLSIKNLSEIESFDFSKYGIQDRSDQQETLPIRQYINNYKSVIDTIDYIDNHGTLDEIAGRKYIEITEPEKVQQYVAHHNGLPEHHGRVEYCKYLVVKYARLFNSFSCGEAAKIELMDTVGLGNKATEAHVLENMYDAIEENSDMVVQIYCPPADSTWRAFFDESTDCMHNIHYKDTIKRIERIPNDALFFVINKKRTPISDNTVGVNGGESTVDQAHRRWGVFNRPETLLIANCSDENEVRDNVMIPILNRMTECLGEIDDIKSAEANGKSKELYQKYRDFISKINEVLIAGADGDKLLNLIDMFNDIFDADIHGKLKDVMQSARENMLRPAGLLGQKLNAICNTTTTGQILKNDKQLKHIISEGIRLHHSYHVIYDNAAAYLRLSIPNRFRSIDNDLQQQIAEKKADVFRCLYNTGRMSAIMSHNGDENISENELINDWAARFASEILNDKEYPFLTRLFNNLLSFTINTEGFLLYRIVKHLDIYDTNYIGYIPANQKEKGVIAHLRNNMNVIFTKITEELNNFTKAPNEAIYFAVEEFFYSLMFDPNCRREMQKLYFTYKRSIWQSELENQVQQTNAFDEWQRVRNDIKTFDKLSKF